MRKTPLSILLFTLLLAACLSPSGSAPQTAAAPSPQPSATTPPSSPFLRVQGRDILDPQGKPILLRGFNFHTYYYAYLWDPAAPQTYATQDDIRFIKNLGANLIRLGFHWRYFDTALGFNLLDEYLTWCEQEGVYVVLDMHVVPPEDDILQGGMWNNPAAQQQFLDLWTKIAARYADRPVVAGYDLYNEPLPPNPADWWALAERAAQAIRAVDANHILFIEEPLGAGLRLIHDPNVVYSYHEYSPFLVSHAAADWVGDAPMPVGYTYPGSLLTELQWADWSKDASSWNVPATEWQLLESGEMTVPPGVEFATLKLSVSGASGAVWFDDLELWRNGEPQSLFNPGLEDESPDRPGQPANWYFWSDSGVTGAWSAEQAHSGSHSLRLTGGEGFGIWTQSNWIFTTPLFRIQPGETFQARGWVLAPQNAGDVQIGLDYLNGVYEPYDKTSLRAAMQPYFDWAAQNNVPLYVGEFGAMSASPGGSRYNLISDMIAIFNENNAHWTLWDYRDPSAPGFGLYFGDVLDERLAEILRQGLKKP